MSSVTATIPIIAAEWSGLPGHIKAFTTTRTGGVSVGQFGNRYGSDGLNLGDHVGDDADSVARNRALLEQMLPSKLQLLTQTHSDIVCNAADWRSGVQADAVYTIQKNMVCAVITADCLPVLFSDTKGQVVAAAHAGWRGLASGILENTVHRMRRAGANNIVAWMGPAIGQTAFEVGADVMMAFQKKLPQAEVYFRPLACVQGPQKYLANLPGLARAVLTTLDVLEVYGGTRCTVSDEERFYSYRRDDVTGRMATLIWMAD